MKKTFLILIVTFVTIMFGIKDWTIYTNTSHSYESLSFDGKLYVASWGGVLVYDETDFTLINKFTIEDNIPENHIKALSVDEQSERVFVGTSSNGVAIIEDFEVTTIINDVNGLVSNRVNNLTFSDSLLYVSTKSGFSIFKIIPEFPIPLSLESYSIDNSPLGSNNVLDIIVKEDKIIVINNDGFSLIPKETLDDITSWTKFSSDSTINGGILKDENLYLRSDDKILTFNENFELNEELGSDYPIYNFFINESKLYASLGTWNESLTLLDYSSAPLDTIIVINNDAITYQNLNIANGEKITSSYSNENYSYFTTWGNGLIRTSKNAKNYVQMLENEVGVNAASNLHSDVNGNLWVASGHFSGNESGLATKGLSKLDLENVWTNYNSDESEIHSNNINGISSDPNGLIWAGSWDASSNASPESWESGVRIYDFENDVRYELEDLISNTISNLNAEDEGMWIMNYDSGISLFDYDREIIQDYEIDESFVVDNPDPTRIATIDFADKSLTVLGTYYSGVLLCETAGKYPTANEWDRNLTKFNVFSNPDLSRGRIYGIAKLENGYNNQIYIAHDTGLYMYDGNRWYDFPTNRKRRYYQGGWQDEYYYDGEEQVIYGSNATIPTALFLDSYSRLWIGTRDQGITMLNTKTLTFTNYTEDDHPLLQYSINTFAYDKITGRLYFGTDSGLGSVNIGGIGIKTSDKVNDIIAFPNPWKPNETAVLTIKAKDRALPQGTNKCNIFDLSGDLVIELEENEFNEFSWDGRNKDGNECSSGLYFYAIGDGNKEGHRGKIVIIR